MNQCLLITGCAGVGKSTVAASLSHRHKNCVCIVGDEIKGWVIDRSDPAIITGLADRGVGLMAELYRTSGYQLVIIDWIVDHPKRLARVRETLQQPLQVIILRATLATCQAREMTRSGRASIPDRVLSGFAAIEDHHQALGQSVDAERPLEAIVEDIEQHLGL